MIYSKIGEGRGGRGWVVVMGLQQPALSTPPPPPTAEFTSQGDSHMRTDAQIKFLYYPLGVGFNLPDHMLPILLKKSSKRKGRVTSSCHALVNK